ncbi:uncharacterized protein LOC128636062 [Bombina bombina]|uniref:uncharacterized protein LOC128636062 n=1 Tax=Bombina bombina TaxID=8345 RepID=UPI00235A4929|nr:uncharacterized protein LOC128636062 [Bombina bombina]
MPRCIVKGCQTKQLHARPTGDASMHTFPTAPERIKLWLESTGQYTENIDSLVQEIATKKRSGNLRMCSKHFTPDCYETVGVSKRLKKDAIPSLFGAGTLVQTLVQTRPMVKIMPAPSIFQSNTTVTENSWPAYILPTHTEDRFQPPPAKKMDDSFAGEITEDGTYKAKDTSDLRTGIVPMDNSNKKAVICMQCATKPPNAKKANKRTTTHGLIRSRDIGTWTGLYEDFVAERVSAGIDMSSVSYNFASVSKQSKTQISSLETKRSQRHQTPTNKLSNSMSPARTAGATVCKGKVKRLSDSHSVLDESSDSLYSQYDEASIAETGDISLGDFSNGSDQKKNPFEERKFIVFESNLDKLLNKLKCSHNGTCNAPIIQSKKNIAGTMVTVYGDCLLGHKVMLWQSQPRIGQMPVGNLLSCTSLLFSGSIYNKIEEFFQLFKIPFISPKTFGMYQKKFLLPAIDHRWKKERQAIINSLQGKMLCLSGDGYHDRKEFHANRCTYTLMEENSKKIIDFHNAQASETSSMMAVESKAFRRCVNNIFNDGLKVYLIATDNHTRIKKVMAEEYKDIRHQFEIWHYTRNLRRKLILIANKRSNKAITPWISTVLNQLWVASAVCEGDANSLREEWNTITYHVTNQHTWEGGTIKRGCHHDDLSKEEEKKCPWLVKGTKAVFDLSEFVHDKQIQQDLTQLTEFCNAANTDFLHSMLLKYRPRGFHFKMNCIEARTKLAILAHNANMEKPQFRKQLCSPGKGPFGALQHKPFLSYPKNQDHLKPVYNSITNDHLHNIMNDVFRLASGTLLRD